MHHTQIIALTDSRLADLRAAIRTASGDAFRDTFLPASHAQAIINVIAHHVLGPQGHATITNICLQSPGAADINYGPATVRGANDYIKLWLNADATDTEDWRRRPRPTTGAADTSVLHHVSEISPPTWTHD